MARRKIRCVVPCSYCGSTLEKTEGQLKGKTYNYCNKKCLSEHQKVIFKGSNNPNYDNKWDVESRARQSEIVKSKVDDDYRKKCSKGMLGKTRSVETRLKHSASVKGVPKKPFTEMHKKNIGVSSAKKFTNEYKKSFRKKMEENGNWIPLSEKTGYEIYFKESEFKFSFQYYLENYASDDEINLIKKYGVFDAKNNTKGCVRDHLLSRRYGFENNIDVKTISSPCNCEIVLHSENVRRAHISSGDDIIDIDELLERINIRNKYAK